MNEPTKQPTIDEVIERGSLEVTLEGLGFQGESWVRLADGWLSVRGALPGERVIVDIDVPRHKTRRLWGTLRQVVQRSARRSDPQCSQFPGCRGCQIRHMPMVDELAYKTETIAQCVERYAELPREEQPAIETITVPGAVRSDAFRVRTHITVRRVPGGWAVGLKAGEHLVEMANCPALSEPARRAVARFEDALSKFDPGADVGLHHARIAAPVHGHGYVELDVDRDEGFEPLLQALDKTFPPNFGIAIIDSRRERRHVRGPRRIRLPMADLRLEVGFDDWFHATLEPAEALYDAITRWLSPKPGERILDAGCGVGTISLICAAAGADVVGFDVNPASVETAELNAINNGLDVRFVRAGWDRAFRDFAIAKAEFDTVVINPMRDPLGHRALAFIPRLGATRVLYLGPSAAPAAKDLQILRGLGFRVDRLAAVNLHPATYHVMLAAMLSR